MGHWLVGMSLGESLGEITGLLLVFVFILTLAWLATRFVARYSAGQLRSGNIHILETHKLAANRYLQLVQVGARYLVLAVSRDQVSLIAELSEEEVQLPGTGISGDGMSMQSSFKDILQKASAVVRKNKDDKR